MICEAFLVENEPEDQIVGFLGDLGQRWPYGDGRWVI